MTKLDDTQRVILAAAGARTSGLILPLPKTLKLTLAKAAPVIESMIKGGRVEERAAVADEPVWRSDDEVGKLTLVVTLEGLRAVGIDPTEAAGGRPSPIPQKSKAGRSTNNVSGRSETKPSRKSSAKSA